MIPAFLEYITDQTQLITVELVNKFIKKLIKGITKRTSWVKLQKADPKPST